MSSVNNKKKGLKINNEKSSIPQPKPDTSAAFNVAADKAYSRIEEYKQRSFDLGTRFKSIIEDRKLAINKTQINKDIEMEILNKLIFLANDLNTDETQPEGAGGTALAMLIMKMMLSQRDLINELAFKIEKIEKMFNVLVEQNKTNQST
jgi:hypothetical protein